MFSQVPEQSPTCVFTKILFSLSILVSPSDTIPPVVNCIEDVVSEIGLNIGGTTVTWIEPTATDNSGVVNLASRSRAPGSFFVVGSTDVTYRFVDGSGNSATCTFSVSVIEGTLLVYLFQSRPFVTTQAKQVLHT